MRRCVVERLACANLSAFPLQLLLKRHPEWTGYPVAVVTEDKPQGLICWVNEQARQEGILPGLRYAAAFSLASGLRAGEVALPEIETAVMSLTKELMRFTPAVEPNADEPGVFWLDGAGLNLLYRSPKKWASAIYSGIAAQGFTASIAVGFTRFGTYALAKRNNGVTVFDDPAEENEAVKEVPLDRLDLEADFRDTLFKLGIKTVGAFLSLPSAGLRERFGPRAHRLYRMAAGELWAPLQPLQSERPVEQKCLLDHAEDDTTRLLFLIKQLLHPMLTALAARAHALAALRMSFLIEGKGWLNEEIRPAAAILDLIQIIDLIRLRLESLKFSAGVTEIGLVAESCLATREQLRLFAERPGRDLDAANRALARLRAEFGETAVAQAKLTDGHLPEARFTWQPLTRLELPRNDLNGLNDLNVLNRSTGPMKEEQSNAKVLVRRIIAKPRPLSSSPPQTHEGGGWLLLGPKYGTIDKLTGPYIFSGGWWNREIQRDYYFAETRRGDLLWVFYDRVRRRWFLQGWVE
jgi:protein ImuB